MKGVQVGEQWCEEPSTVQLEAKSLFESRFKATKDLGLPGRSRIQVFILVS